jgi:molecular chaperone DnaK (HSP70)
MNDILISLESEAASLTMFDDPSISNDLKEKGKIFILIDAGGYTVDITLNKFVDNYSNLKLLSPPSGGNFGSMHINLKIIQFIEDIFGKENIEKFKENNLEKWVLFKNEIEEKKIASCSYDSDNSDFKIENYFSNSYFLLTNKTYETNYGTISYDKKFIYIPNSLLKNMIKTQINKIIVRIEKLFNNFNDRKIDQIVITGGFSNCEIIKKKLTETFRQTVISQLFNPESSIAKGAALYGIKPNQIISRISPFTYGVSGYEPQRKGFQCRNKKIIKNNK